MARDGRYQTRPSRGDVNRHATDPRSAFYQFAQAESQMARDRASSRSYRQLAEVAGNRASQRVGTMQRIRARYPHVTQEQAFAIADGQGTIGPDGRYTSYD